MDYSDNYLKQSGSLWQLQREQLNANLTDSESFRSKIEIKENTPTDGNTKNIEIVVPLKY